MNQWLLEKPDPPTLFEKSDLDDLGLYNNAATNLNAGLQKGDVMMSRGVTARWARQWNCRGVEEQAR